MPFAARLTDMHLCPMATPGTPPVPHIGGPVIASGAVTVRIEGLPAARVTDRALCMAPVPDVIVRGSSSIIIEGLPAARVGDSTAHGGIIIAGAVTVQMGG